MHIMIALGILSGLIAFAFGEVVARAVVGSAIIAAALFFAYVMFRIMEGSI